MLPDCSAAVLLQGLRVCRAELALTLPIDAQIDAGQLWHIRGENGTGKTSLLMLLAGLLPASLQQLQWGGLPADEWPTLYLGHLAGLNSRLTVRQNLSFLAQLSGQVSHGAALDEALWHVGLTGYDDVPVARLSSGQKRRVNLARLWLADAPPLWLLDEPFTALDVAMVAGLETQLLRHAQQGGRVVLTSHQPVRGVTHVLLLDDYRLLDGRSYEGRSEDAPAANNALFYAEDER